MTWTPATPLDARNARRQHPFAKVEDEILSIIREPAIERNRGEANAHQ